MCQCQWRKIFLSLSYALPLTNKSGALVQRMMRVARNEKHTWGSGCTEPFVVCGERYNFRIKKCVTGFNEQDSSHFIPCIRINMFRVNKFVLPIRVAGVQTFRRNLYLFSQLLMANRNWVMTCENTNTCSCTVCYFERRVNAKKD